MPMMNYGGYGTYQQQPSPSMPLIWVENEMEARNTYVANGTTVFFMERNNQRMYAKSVAMNGLVDSFRIFEFTEVTPQETTNNPIIYNAATHEDLNNAIGDLKKYIDEALRNNTNRRNNYNKDKGENHG